VNCEQVDFQASSLNSSDVFVVCTGAICYIWCGKGSTGDEREMAKKIAQAVSGPEYVALFEGKLWETLCQKKWSVN
jgi:villin 1